MNIKRVLDRVYNVSLPIYGSFGESIDKPIVFEKGAADYVALEYRILGYLADLQGYKFETVQQTLLKKGTKFYDKITVKITSSGSSTFSYSEYYFDISDCLKKRSMSLIKNV